MKRTSRHLTVTKKSRFFYLAGCGKRPLTSNLVRVSGVEPCYSHHSTRFDSAQRDEFLFFSTLLVRVLILFTLVPSSIFAQKVDPIKLSWLGGKSPAMATGVSWGVPLPEGKITPSVSFSLKNKSGQALPIQSWPLAFWPDGSLKWVGLSTIVDDDAGMTFELEPLEKGAANNSKIKIELIETSENVLVNTGGIQCEIPKNGERLIRYIKMGGKSISTGGKLVCILQDGPSSEFGVQPFKELFIGKIEEVTVEQNGPVRAVIKIEGRHVSESGERSSLPFVVRLYFYSGQQSIRVVHTIMYDGDQEKDFVRGLGVVFDVPMDEQLYNRHVRFSGENGGLWDEPCQPLNGRFPLDRNEDLYAKQLTGERIAERETFSENQQSLIEHWASWNDFKLEQ